MLGLVEMKNEGCSSFKRQGKERREEFSGREISKKNIKAMVLIIWFILGEIRMLGFLVMDPIFVGVMGDEKVDQQRQR